MSITNLRLRQLEKEHTIVKVAAGLTVTKGQILSSAEDGYVLADCSSLETIQGTVIAVDDQIGDEVVAITSGIQEITNGKEGQNVYIGKQGVFTTTAPSVAGEWIKCIGTVINALQWRFEPDAVAVMNSDNVETWVENVLSEKVTQAEQGLNDLNGAVGQVRTEVLALDDKITELHGTLISDPVLKAAVENLSTRVTGVEANKVSLSEKGTANGVATLDSSGQVPAQQLPSYVDDIVERDNFAALPAPGEKSKIYVTIDNNKTWRWTGTVYVEVSPTAGNADTATKLLSARTISVSGDMTGSASFDGSSNISIQTTLANEFYTKAEVDTIIGNVESILTGLGV